MTWAVSLRHPIDSLTGYARFLADLARYRRTAGAETVQWRYIYPCLKDRRSSTPIDPLYFLQDTWAAGRVFEAKPPFHVDIGSTALLVGILAQFTRVYSLDIRPLAIRLAGLSPCSGSVTALPLRSLSVPSLSSLCVLEHIGLGRYGDALDPRGTDRATAELQRVLAPGGNLYVSVPIEETSRLYFNAHRCYRAEDFVTKFPELSLVEGLFVQGAQVYSHLNQVSFSRGMVFGLFHFGRLE